MLVGLILRCHIRHEDKSKLTLVVASLAKIVLLLVHDQTAALDVEFIAGDKRYLGVSDVHRGNTLVVGSDITCSCGHPEG